VYGLSNVCFDVLGFQDRLYFAAQKISSARKLTKSMNFTLVVYCLCVENVLSNT
jgi:hypothetical protein